MQKTIESISSAPPIAHINDIKDHIASLENRIPALESQNVTMRRALDAIVGLGRRPEGDRHLPERRRDDPLEQEEGPARGAAVRPVGTRGVVDAR